MIRGQILLKREGMMWISPTPSAIMPTTHWRCELGQSQELGQVSIEWACSKYMEQNGPREAWDIKGA